MLAGLSVKADLSSAASCVLGLVHSSDAGRLSTPLALQAVEADKHLKKWDCNTCSGDRATGLQSCKAAWHQVLTVLPI